MDFIITRTATNSTSAPLRSDNVDALERYTYSPSFLQTKQDATGRSVPFMGACCSCIEHALKSVLSQNVYFTSLQHMHVIFLFLSHHAGGRVEFDFCPFACLKVADPLSVHTFEFESRL